MKSTIWQMILIGFLAAAAITCCNNSSANKTEKNGKFKQNLVQVRQQSEQARLDSINEYLKCKEESEMKCMANESKIAKLRKFLKEENRESFSKYENLLDQIEQKNTKLKIRINEYKIGGKNKWVLYEADNQELDELGKSLSTLAEKKSQKT